MSDEQEKKKAASNGNGGSQNDNSMLINADNMKKNHSDTQILPPELITEILLRLPVISLLHFKCVCKSWLSQISDPQFGISHFDLAASPTHRFLIPNNGNYYAQSINTDMDHTHSNPLHILVPIPQPDRYNRLFKPHILGSCRGFILLYYALTNDLILWNPSNAVHKQLPHFLSCLTRQSLHGFGHDPSLDEYILILIRLCVRAHALRYRTKIQVFSFKTNSRNTYSINVPYNSILGEQFRAGLLLNGALHWLVFSRDKKVLVIIAFDLIQRSLSEIPLSRVLTKETRKVFSLMVLRGCLGVCCRVQGFEVTEIWVMKEYKVGSSWTESFFIPPFAYGNNPSMRFSPICDTKDGGIFGSNITRLEKLNDRGQLLEHFTYDSGQRLFRGNLQSAMYTESLLSLPSVTGANK